MMSRDAPVQNTFLFIPDISGFTRFMGDSDFQHRQYLIAELLEVLIDSNQLQLQVSEVEGDAIFFYRVGALPDMKEIIAQSERMYFAFHHHLKTYGISRVCNCMACRKTAALTLKFFAHYGPVSFHKVKDHQKLFGSDVILIHRLMKNNIDQDEYLLITDALRKADHQVNNPDLDWVPGTSTYDMGDVNYTYSSLQHWYTKVPEPRSPEPELHRAKNSMEHRIQINAPMDVVYDALIDLNQRKNYMTGVNAVHVRQQELNKLSRICTTFECSLEHEKCTFEISQVAFNENGITFSETLKQHPITFDYVIHSKDAQTDVAIIVHPAMKFPMNALFNLFMKHKFRKETNESLRLLKQYCESKTRTETGYKVS